MKLPQRLAEPHEGIAQNAAHVSIESSKFEELSLTLAKIERKHWLDGSPVNIKSLDLREALLFTFLLDSISFCYWEEPRWEVYVKPLKRNINGSWALIYCLDRWISKKSLVLSEKALLSLNRNEFEHITHGTRRMPLFDERVSIINSLGLILAESYDSNILNLIESCGGSSRKLLETILEMFPSFHDEVTLQGKKIPYIKRAQLLTADIAHVLKAKNAPLQLDTCDFLTACADYKIPQILHAYGVLSYSDILIDKLKTCTEITKNSQFEIEIRSSTIIAVERIKSAMAEIGEAMTSNEINDMLWLMSQNPKPDWLPYHMVRTTAY